MERLNAKLGKGSYSFNKFAALYAIFFGKRSILPFNYIAVISAFLDNSTNFVPIDAHSVWN